MRVLIVEDGNQRGALAAVRALGDNGAWVAVAAPHRGLSASSRWCRHYHPAPSPWAGSQAFLRAVKSAIATTRPDLVFPVGDAELFTLSAARAELDTGFPYPDHAAVLAAFDKLELSTRARRVGLDVPDMTTSSEGLTDLEFPVVVKERLHGAGETGFSITPQDAVVAETEDAAARCMKKISRDGGQPLAQAFVNGDLMALIVLVDAEHVPLAVVQQRALRTFPPAAGVSTRARVEPVDQVLAEKSVRLLRDLGWIGLAELQFISPAGGAPRLIDFNGRFYGSLALATRAGADLASAWSASALGRVTKPNSARIGQRYQWLEGDLRRALTERRGGLIRDVASCLSFAPGAVHSIWSARDPLPALRFAVRLAARGPAKARARWS